VTEVKAGLDAAKLIFASQSFSEIIVQFANAFYQPFLAVVQNATAASKMAIEESSEQLAYESTKLL
jgi:hypothetical protein